MSDYRINIMKVGHQEVSNHINFDSKEDAEHYAKNTSLKDGHHRYEVQKNNHGTYSTIKAYVNGQVIG